MFRRLFWWTVCLICFFGKEGGWGWLQPITFCEKTSVHAVVHKFKSKTRLLLESSTNLTHCRAANNYFTLKGHMSHKGTILVGQKENLVGHKHKGTFERVVYKNFSQILFLNDIVKCCNKKLARQKLMSDQGCDFIGHWQILVGHCPMTDCYLQLCIEGQIKLILKRSFLHR